MKNSRLIENKWLLLPTLILLAYMLIRLINQSTMIHTFALDTTNDWSSHIARLHFLKVCGFHNFCPYWYGGFNSFLVSSPGWFFFAFPLYLLFGNVTTAAYVSVILIFISALIASFKIGSVLKFSKRRSLFLFAFYFGNSIALGNFIRLGRPGAALAFALGLWLLYIILKYKDQKITPRFLLITPIYTCLILTHYQEAILFSLLPLGLFIYKKNPLERSIIVLSLILAIIFSLFWTYPFLIAAFSTEGSSILTDTQSERILELTKEVALTLMVSIIVPISFIIIFIARFASSKNRSKLVKFYSPILILAGIFLFRLHTFIPFLKNISPDPFIMFLLLFTLILLLELKGSSKFFKKLVITAIILISIISILISHIHTPYFTEYTQAEHDLLDVLEHTPGNYLIFQHSTPTSYANAYYCLAPIKFNLSTPAGWYPYIASKEYLTKIEYLNNLFEDNDCNRFIDSLRDLKTDYAIGYADYCDKLSTCGLKTEYTKGEACLLSVPYNT